MSLCNICDRKETRNRVLSMVTNICAECTEKIKNNEESISKELDVNVMPPTEYFKI